MNTPMISAQDIIALTLLRDVGRKTIHLAVRLAVRAGRPMAALFGADTRGLLDLAAPGEEPAARALNRCSAAEIDEASGILARCEAFGIRHWTCLDPAYPPFVAETLGTQAPPLLFYQGNEALLDEPGAGIVGTRRPTGEGAEWARRAAVFCAGEGYTVMSGGAAGIDMEAHRAALKADGTTAVILPEGLLAHNTHPAIRTGLRNGQVLLLCEFLPSEGWKTHQAMTRNRTIAACSRAICVVEPGEKGGSMYTAEQALDQGKAVFYWGGACRDGALRDRANAASLGRHGELAEAALRAALDGTPRPAPKQGDLFGQGTNNHRAEPGV